MQKRMRFLTILTFLPLLGNAIAATPAKAAGSTMEAVERAATAGNAGAQSLLGVVHLNQAFAGGTVHRAELTQAIHWFQSATANSAIDAKLKTLDQTLLGFLFSASGQDAAGRKALAAPVESKDGLAEFVMAMTYSPQAPGSLPIAGLKWFEKSAQHGFAPADIALGLMYLEGSGVPRQPEMAQHWLQDGSPRRLSDSRFGDVGRQQHLRAAQGRPEDQFALALQELLEGEINEASPWLARAARQNYLLAELTIAQLALKGQHGQYANAAVSRRWFIGAVTGILGDPALRERWMKPITTITVAQ